jgi:ATP-dependent RNA helicase DDX19/DBP5
MQRQPDLLKGIYDMGFSKPSKIQERALPLLLSNPLGCPLSLTIHIALITLCRPTNMIGQSQSGTGKTAAFVLTMLSQVDFSLNKPQVRSSFVLQGTPPFDDI